MSKIKTKKQARELILNHSCKVEWWWYKAIEQSLSMELMFKLGIHGEVEIDENDYPKNPLIVDLIGIDTGRVPIEELDTGKPVDMKSHKIKKIIKEYTKRAEEEYLKIKSEAIIQSIVPQLKSMTKLNIRSSHSIKTKIYSEIV